MNGIGIRIKKLRALARLSQEELGGRVGVQRAAINKYEKRKCHQYMMVISKVYKDS